MSRHFAPITHEALRRKLTTGAENEPLEPYELLERLGRDIKVKFDCENWVDTPSNHIEGMLGTVTFSNGLTAIGISAGGDWEFPVYFIVYWDGKKLRGYVPTAGNPWNRKTKQAYGNDADADLADVIKHFPTCLPDGFDPKEENEFEVDWLEWSQEEIEADMVARIQPDPKLVEPEHEQLQRRIEATKFYGTGDEAYELFEMATRFCYKLSGLGCMEEAKQVCKWAEEMAESSKIDAETLDNLDDVESGVWGN